MNAAESLLAILDCPACRQDRGLVPQEHEGGHYLACPSCTFWYPIEEEVVVLLVPERNPGGRRAAVGAATPVPIERRASEFVDAKALVYSYYSRMHEFGKLFGLDAEPVVVDVGCSTGSLAVWLRPEQTYIGFDLSFASLRFARRASGQFFVQADAERLPVKTGSVPYFTSREVLEHVDDPLAAVRELRRVAKRGVIVVPTLDFPFLYDPLNWVLIRRGKRAKFGAYGYGHHELRDIAGWRDLIGAGGFEVLSEHAVGTGLFLNAFDVFWHSLFSWREFDNLPRRGVPVQIARSVFPFERLLHKLDGPLFTGRTLSHGFAVRPA